jgi:O-antigen/teichoic acid export membrane protein
MGPALKPALVLMSGRSAALLATFLVPLVLVRVFDPAGFGTYKQTFLIYAIVYQIGVVISESLFYFLPRSPEQGGRYVANAVLALAGAGLVGLALLCAGAATIAGWFGNPELARHLPLIGVFLALMLPASPLEMVMIARKRYRAASWSYAVTDVMRAVVLAALALAVGRLEWILVGACACAAARLCAALLYFHREFPAALRPQAALYRSQMAYVLPFALAVVVELLQINYHNYAVSSRFDAAIFAVYAVGCFQVPLIELMASPMANVMMVRMQENIRDGNGREAARIWAGTSRALALVFFPLTAVLLVSAPDLITFLFTERYRASVPIFMIWSLSIVLSAMPTDGVLRVYAATRFLLAVSAARLVLIAALIGAFISRWGLSGAVLATILLAVAGKAAGLVRMGRLMGVGPAQWLPWRDLARIAGVAAAATLPAIVLGSALVAPVFARLALIGLLYAACYAALLFYAGLLAEDEKRALTGWFQRWPLATAGEMRT